MILFVLFSALNYVIGSVPFALVVGKYFYKTDVREFGSGNLGATNTGRVLGKVPAILVTLGDALKGAIFFWIESIFSYPAALAASIFFLVGHCWPLFANFKGGKAVATTFGMIFALSFVSFKAFIFVFLLPVGLWFAVSKFTDYVSLASLFAILVACDLSTIFSGNIYISCVMTVYFIIVAYRHKENIIRLIKGTENKKNY